MKALAVIFVISIATVSAHENNGRGAKAIAIANAFTSIADNSWAVSYNPAGLAQLVSPQVATFFIPQQFGIPELRTISLSAAYSINPGTIGAVVEQFGFDLYRTTEIALGYGLALDSLISVGASIDVERVAIERYGVSYNTTFDIALLGHPLANLSLGFCLKNVTAARIGTTRDRLPQYFMFGASYTPFRDFCLVSEIEKDAQFPLAVKVGVEEKFFGFLSLRCGVGDNPDKFSAGIAVQYSTIEFGYAGYSHPELGWTHQIEISMRWDD